MGVVFGDFGCGGLSMHPFRSGVVAAILFGKFWLERWLVRLGNVCGFRCRHFPLLQIQFLVLQIFSFRFSSHASTLLIRAAQRFFFCFFSLC